MAQIYVKYNPYRMKTEIKVNGNELTNDNLLQHIKGKRLQEWISEFPKLLIDVLNTRTFDFEFYGMALDWDDFKEVITKAEETKLIQVGALRFTECRSDDDINAKIVDVFTRLQEGPVEDFRDPQLQKAFQSINSAVFPINIIGTMSSGKSTLINALLEKRLMPSKNQACTDKITEILDNDNDRFHAVVYDANDQVLESIQDLTYDIMNRLNDEENVRKIEVEGNIPFLNSSETALELIDTPGTNNSRNQEHKNTTYRALNSGANSLILYILNGTQLQTNDDANLLDYVAKQIQKGGKQVRDRFLFVVNKMDDINPEDEDVQDILKDVRAYLGQFGIEDPQVFPCSAFTALNLQVHLKGIDIDNLSRSEERKLPAAAKDAITMAYKFMDYPTMHLERYSTLSPSAQNELYDRLKSAETLGDTNEQVMIHCGICSIEAAITAYVKKYARTKKIKDLVESFEQVLESSQVLVKAKTQVATDEETAKACAERAAAVREKIEDGQEAQAFKKKVAEIDPMPTIEEKAEKLKAEVGRKSGLIFKPYGDVLDDRKDAERLVQQFATMTTDYIAEMTAELEAVIDHEVVESGKCMLAEYQEKLLKIDENAGGRELDFSTADLIRGALSNMKEKAADRTQDRTVMDTVDEYGKETVENRTWYEKTGQKAVRVGDGVEKVKVGTRRVKVGSHKVYNTDKRWFKPWTWLQKSYEMVDDYKDEDVFETKVKYKTVMQDQYKEHHETVRKYQVDVAELQAGLVSQLDRTLDDGIREAVEYADKQTEEMKVQFTAMFDELDKLIQEKYAELEQVAADEQNRQNVLEQSRSVLNWIEACQKQVNEAIDF